MSDGYDARLLHLPEEWDHAPSAPDHVAVAHHAEARPVPARIGVPGHKEFVRAELRGPVEVNGICRLVRGEGDDLLDPLVYGRVDEVGGTHDVGTDHLDAVVL